MATHPNGIEAGRRRRVWLTGVVCCVALGLAAASTYRYRWHATFINSRILPMVGGGAGYMHASLILAPGNLDPGDTAAYHDLYWPHLKFERDTSYDWRRYRRLGLDDLRLAVNDDQKPAGALLHVNVQVPSWVVLVLSVAATAGMHWRMAVVQRHKTINAARLICLVCGYDLRASPGRCPECGTEPPRQETPADSATKQPT